MFCWWWPTGKSGNDHCPGNVPQLYQLHVSCLIDKSTVQNNTRTQLLFQSFSNWCQPISIQSDWLTSNQWLTDFYRVTDWLSQSNWMTFTECLTDFYRLTDWLLQSDWRTEFEQETHEVSIPTHNPWSVCFSSPSNHIQWVASVPTSRIRATLSWSTMLLRLMSFALASSSRRTALKRIVLYAATPCQRWGGKIFCCYTCTKCVRLWKCCHNPAACAWDWNYSAAACHRWNVVASPAGITLSKISCQQPCRILQSSFLFVSDGCCAWIICVERIPGFMNA